MTTGTEIRTRERAREGSVRQRAKTFDRESRTVDVTLATGDLVMMPWGREALPMEAVVLDAGSEIPFIDSHNRSTIRNIMGRARNLRTEGNELAGRIKFSRNERGQEAMDLAEDEMLTDVSIGYVVETEEFVREGETKTMFGRQYSGPAWVATRWYPMELSGTAVGADTNAKLRAAAQIEVSKPESPAIPSKEASRMEANKTPETPPVEPVKTQERAAPEAPATPAKVDTVVVDKRHAEVREVCKLAGLNAERTLAYLDDSKKTVDQIRAEIIAERERENQPVKRTVVEAGADARDKFRAAAVDAILLTAGLSVAKPAAGADELRGLKLAELAREAHAVCNVRAPRREDELFRSALDRRGSLFRQGERSSGVYNHSTSDFPYILADVVNKSIGIGYQAAPVTYPLWTRSVPFSDFKTRYVPRLSSVPDPSAVTETSEIPEVALSEDQESYGIVTYGNIVSITRKTLINDDLGAFTRVPMMMGNALRRKFQKIVSTIVNEGASSDYNMNDGNPLFDATNHLNYGTSGTAFGETTLAAAWTAMAKQTGLGGERISVTPRWLLIPPDLYIAARKLLESTGSVTTEQNSGVINPLRGLVTPIVDPFMVDATSNGTTAWALVADNSQIDTVEVGLLNGVDAPAVEEQEGFEVLGMRFRIYAEFGAKAIDWRGILKRTGQA